MLSKEKWKNSDAEKLHDLGMIYARLSDAHEAVGFAVDLADSRHTLPCDTFTKLYRMRHELEKILVDMGNHTEERVGAAHSHYLRSVRLAEIEGA